MSETETIKSFLVGLGFKVDESSERKFTDSVARATKTAMALGAAVEAAALTVRDAGQAFAVPAPKPPRLSGGAATRLPRAVERA